ncbi:MAG TPA: arginine--tRNA ligase [Streptosporangiaceae bacterium]|nr:arginine--tRNA ligase [Streptosporangiaceae bacterium]
MADPREVLAHRVTDALGAAFGPAHAGADPLIRPSAFADFQSNAALSLARQLGRPPREVAAELAGHLDVTGVADPPEVSGPGFINFTLATDWIAAQAQSQLADQRLGSPAADPPQKVVVDYSGPNVAKELHVGHLRATVVGDAVVRILEYLGHTVVREAHLGDWGTPFGMMIEHALDIGEAATHELLAAGEITAFYQAARAKFVSDPAFADRARRRVGRLQAGDDETMRLWQILVSSSMEYLTAIYQQLRVTLTSDDMAPESFYNPMLADVCKELEADGIAVISEGALCAFPPGFTGRDGAPLPLILRKSDGGYGYGTTDVAAIRHRLVDQHADRIIYVVGSEQSQHLQMVFAVAREAGWLTGGARAEHAVIGMVTGADGKRLRTREGEQVKLSMLLDEAVERAAAVIADRYADPALRAQIAEAVGIGAVKYGDLSVARDSSYAFDFDRMLALTGNTGPYLQYATTRIRSIFRRGGLDPDAARGPVRIGEPAERALALALLGFGTVLGQSAEDAEPHRLAGFLFDVASAFTTFYEECPVLQAPDEASRESRLALSALTLRVLSAGLGLLGVPVPERM